MELTQDIIDDIEVGVISQSIIDEQEAYRAEHGKYQHVPTVTNGDYSLRIDELAHPSGNRCFHLLVTKIDGEKTYSKAVTCKGDSNWEEIINDIT